MFEESTPNVVIENLQIVVGGDAQLSNNRNTIGNITGNTIGPNSNFQGSNVRQTNIQGSPKLEQALEELVTEIESLQDTDKKDNAYMYYENLQRSIEYNEQNRIEACLKNLHSILGSVASITTIAQQFAVFL